MAEERGPWRGSPGLRPPAARLLSEGRPRPLRVVSTRAADPFKPGEGAPALVAAGRPWGWFGRESGFPAVSRAGQPANRFAQAPPTWRVIDGPGRPPQQTSGAAGSVFRRVRSETQGPTGVWGRRRVPGRRCPGASPFSRVRELGRRCGEELVVHGQMAGGPAPDLEGSSSSGSVELRLVRRAGAAARGAPPPPRWARLDSNQGPTDYESAALTAELRARHGKRSARPRYRSRPRARMVRIGSACLGS
jgi:hypothetical protein